MSSAELHHTILFVYGLNGEINSLGSMTSAVSNLFLPGSLFAELDYTPEASPEKYQLLDSLLVEHVRKISTPIVDRFELDDIETVGKAIGIDTKYVRTRFFIESYRASKDSSVDDLLASNAAYLDRQLFLNEIVQILCERLDSTITSLKKTKNYRSVLSILDASTTRWIKEQAAKGSSAPKQQAPVSLIATHSLVIRCQSMARSVSDETLYQNIMALNNMSATLLKAVQTQGQQTMSI